MNKQISADDLYDDLLQIIKRRMQGDPNVKEAEYQTAKEIMVQVFIGIRFDRENSQFPENIDER